MRGPMDGYTITGIFSGIGAPIRPEIGPAFAKV